MSIANEKIVNLQDAKVLYDDLRGRIKDNAIVEVLDTPAAIQSFSDAARFPMELKVGIDPVQDLHGYDHPWVGGAGKNLLNNTAETTTNNGVTFTVNTDGTVSTSGTADGTAVFRIWQAIDVSSDIILSGCPAGGDYSNGYCMMCCKSNGQNVASSGGIDTGEGATIPAVSVQLISQTQIIIRSGVNANGLVFKPMIRLATETDSTFEPYSNICPISGWDGAKVTVTGRNLFDEKYDNISVYVTYRPIYVGDGTFTMSTTCPKNSSNACNLFFASGRVTTGVTTAVNGVDVTTPRTFNSIDGYITVAYRSELAADPRNYKTQIEKGSTATTYEPFGTTYSISFPTSTGTVYGGELTIHSDGSGELVVDKAAIILTGTEKYRNAVGLCPVALTLPGFEYGTAITIQDQISNAYKAVSGRWDAVPNGSFRYIDNVLGVRDDINMPDQATGIQYIASMYAAGTPLTFVLKLNTPITYFLTPGQVFALLGTNYVWANCGQINYLEYVRDVVCEVIPNRFDGLEQDIVDTNTYEKTISEANAIQTFEDGAEWPIGMQIAVDPVQDLHGYDHPWPAGGGKNLFQRTMGNASGSGIQYTYNDDGSIVVTGTATANTSNNIGTFTAKAGVTYILTGTPTSIADNESFVRFHGPGATEYTFNLMADKYHEYQREIQFDTDTTGYVDIRIGNGKTINNLVFQPMIRLATVSDSTFVPYSNVCPISGWTGANVTVTGKNLIPNWVDNTVISYTNGTTFSHNNYKTTGFIPVKTGDKIYVITETTGGEKWWYDIYKNPYQAAGGIPGVKTAPCDGYFRMSATNENVDGTMVFYGESATTFEAMQSTIYPITFPTSAGTVYGGNLTVNKDGTGELIVDKARLKVSECDWEGYDLQYNRIVTKPLTGYKTPSASLTQPFECDSYDVYSGGGGIGNVSDFQTYIGYASSKYRWCIQDSRVNTKADFIALMGDCTAILPLATPITYTLTPGQVLSLLGKNNVWADTGNILSLTYNSKQGIEFIREDTAGQINAVVNPVKAELNDAEAAMAIVVDGDTAPKNITSGQYVFVKNHSTLATGMYHATAAISSGASITSNNVEADADGGFNALNSNKKNVQTAVSNPTASGTATAFVSGITQNAQGVISPTRANVPTASTSVAGLVQLNNTLTSTSTTQALTAAQGKALNGNIASLNSNIVNNSVTGTNAVTTTHTIVDARLAKLGHLAILTATIDLTANVSAWTSVFKINDVRLQASTYVFADVNNEIKEFYIGTDGGVSCTSALTSGKEVKITIPIAVK